MSQFLYLLHDHIIYILQLTTTMSSPSYWSRPFTSI